MHLFSGDNAPEDIHTALTQEDEKSEINFYNLHSNILES